jgi:hypothetical protein
MSTGDVRPRCAFPVEKCLDTHIGDYGLKPMRTAEVLHKAPTKASPIYSLRNACMGSTDAARRAGTRAANEEQAKSKMRVPLITDTSSGFTL